LAVNVASTESEPLVAGPPPPPTVTVTVYEVPPVTDKDPVKNPPAPPPPPRQLPPPPPPAITNASTAQDVMVQFMVIVLVTPVEPLAKRVLVIVPNAAGEPIMVLPEMLRPGGNVLEL
jgi:hypothetical protein